MKWLREAISDEEGLADIAYIALLALMLAVGAILLFICVMVAVSYWTGKAFDPLPLGQAVALICGAFFGTGLTGLAAYMLATRKQPKAPPQTVIAPQASLVAQVQPAETDVEPSKRTRR